MYGVPTERVVETAKSSATGYELFLAAQDAIATGRWDIFGPLVDAIVDADFDTAYYPNGAMISRTKALEAGGVVAGRMVKFRASAQPIVTHRSQNYEAWYQQ